MAGDAHALKKVLRPVHLWGIAVGLVISGEYFGWNYGWGVAGTVGFLIATALVTVFYVAFIFSFTELTAAIPHAGGPFAYAYKALGAWGGLVAGYATLIEFLLAPPAIALALGSYAHFLHPALPARETGVACFVVFTIINWLGIKESAVFSVVVTILAVIELLLFMGIVAPGFKMEHFLSNPMPFGWQGVFAALPFAIWFYLAIEGVAMVAEEVKDPQRNIPKGYLYGIFTLVLLALGVMVFTGGVGNWEQLSNIDYPLPEAIGMVLGKQNSWTKFFTGIGLFGLIASFHGIILGYSRQLFALSRSGYLPRGLSTVNSRFQTPHRALLAGGFIGIGALYIGSTDQVIILSAMGAIVMYIISLVSLFILRKKEPQLPRPFKAPLYPWTPLIALLIALLCLVAMVWYNGWISVIFLVGLLAVALLFIISGRHRKPLENITLEESTAGV